MDRRRIVALSVLGILASAALALAAMPTNIARQLVPILLLLVGLAMQMSDGVTEGMGRVATLLALVLAVSSAAPFAPLAGVAAAIALAIPTRPTRAWWMRAAAVATPTAAFFALLPAAAGGNSDLLAPATLLIFGGLLLLVAVAIGHAARGRTHRSFASTSRGALR